jgi:UDP-N-acetylmuramoylalanine--D-glutamate ligase
MPRAIELKGKRVLVVGLARTGVATARFCAQRGASVVATDLRSAAEVGGSVDEFQALGVETIFGEGGRELMRGVQLTIPSPGVPADAPILQLAREMKIPVWSEIELAYRFLQGRLIGITGSNGKTTTTSLIEHILGSSGVPAILAGNIGTPMIACVEKTSAASWMVAELSSFQLELVESFRPEISVFLNLTPDHLDRHKSMEAYAAAKARIFENQEETDAAVLNSDDAATRELAPQKPRVFWFSRKLSVAQGAFVRDGRIVFRENGSDEEVMRVQEIPLPGAHNLENVLAAASAARLAGVPAAKIAEAVRSFAGVEHRLEFVTEIGGVRYYNDSKATNVDATLKALDAFPGRIVVILGGKDKGSDYAPLRAPLREKAILALLIGASAEKIAMQIDGSVALERAETLDRAVEAAAKAAQRGDIVLLAPACASFDQFQNYEDRGKQFKELVHQLENQATGARNGGR